MDVSRSAVLSFLSTLLILASSLWTSQVWAQSGCKGCSGSYPAVLQATKARKDCLEGNEVRCYQRYIAAQNMFNNCLNQGCDTGMPTGNEPTGSGSGDGSGGADGTGDQGSVPDPDSDRDGVPDRADKCSGTAAGTFVDDKGCPAKMELTVSVDKTGWVDIDGEILKNPPPGSTVNIGGTVKDADGNAMPGVSLLIEIEGTGLSTLAGTMMEVAYYTGPIDLPLDIEAGTYTVKVTASKDGYPDVTKTTKLIVGGTQLVIGLKTPADVPIEEEVDWEISVTGEYTVYMADVDLKVILTHLDTGKSTVYSDLPRTTIGRTVLTGQFDWKRKWSEAEVGNWQIVLRAFKEGYVAGYEKRSFTVGEHTVKFEDKETDVSCWPNCNVSCRPYKNILDHPDWNASKCYCMAKCSRLHDVRYEFTAEAGTLGSSSSTYPSLTWKAPDTPGTYTINVRAVCTKDPTVSDGATISRLVVTDAQHRKSAYSGKIEMRGYDRVKIEKVEGDEDGDVEIDVKDPTGEFTEVVEAGRWLEGDDWSVFTGFETKVTLGVYRKGKRVGEVKLGELSNYKLKVLRSSTFGWLHEQPMTSPYILFYSDEVPDRRFKEVDFSVSTPTCTSSRRGTKFFVAYDDEKNESTVGVLEGEVSVTPLLFGGAPRVVTAHEWTTVDEVDFGQTQEMTRAQIENLAEIFPESADGPANDAIPKSSGDRIHAEGFHFFDDFSGDLEEIEANWNVDDLYVELDDGKLFFEPDDEVWALKLNRRVPLQKIAVEFDGWTEGQSLHIVFSNENDDTFSASIGSGSYAGISLFSGNTMVATVRGQAFEAGAWSHFELTQKDGVVEVSVDGKPVISGDAPDWMQGSGYLSITANGRPVMVDNVKVYELQ